MKALCVAVVLSLVSASQAAPLTCEKLLTPAEKGPELSGRWHYIALSTELCLPTSILNTFFWPSLAMEITAKDTPNIYDGMSVVKMYGYCFNDSEAYKYENNKIFDVNDQNVPTGDADVMLYTSCPDCIVIKSNDIVDSLILLSRRKTISDAEMKEFEQQTNCRRWSKPLVLNSDHEHDKCQFIDENISEEEASDVLKNVLVGLFERVKTTHQSFISCLVESFIKSFSTTSEN
ncbi:uncharacterized protein [Nothobranchius furzeri]|uniref:LOC107384930-like protein n=2 Tax=Nothobranchius TaxID=28779 RepID=A0A1A7ZZZ2_NOTFU|nr:uncharacterized protein LOC107384930 [Nothobranchius furzeri]KAF7207539.1 putative LOC107384930-like protein [Nothobranchius furzeri]